MHHPTTPVKYAVVLSMVHTVALAVVKEKRAMVEVAAQAKATEVAGLQ